MRRHYERAERLAKFQMIAIGALFFCAIVAVFVIDFKGR
jgi:hypothetical protein